LPDLPPIATAEERRALARRNRRLLAERLGWPALALELCERLDDAHPGWRFTWFPESSLPGWQRPAGFAAHRPGLKMRGEDQLRRAPEDGVERVPRCFGETVADLEQRIAEVEERRAAHEAERERIWASMRPPTNHP
jgi:hypothetical protein